ncbi:hypothetical protein H6503_00345 [Candidatus Woesearchaeota archaeon]|nr:hypothetical protein [Candidatus Woesearchaeota archaeon]
MKAPRIILFFFLLVFTVSIAYAQNNHITLLAVSEGNGTMTGSTADLSLEIRDGSGKVFIDTYPLSKFDTQLSIRFAKDVACKFSKIDCSKYDFLYTIRAKSRIIGGPSAGAAIAVLTYAQLNDLDIDPKSAITGTINSGRLIGNVGGIKQKIEGAVEQGLTKVLIPVNEIVQENESNDTIDMVEYGESLGIQVFGASDLEEAIYYITGKDLRTDVPEISIDPQYTEIMNGISNQLCDRSLEILNLIDSTGFKIDNVSYNGQPLNQTLEDAEDQLKDSMASYKNEQYYASSSQCFGANTKLYFIYLVASGLPDSEYAKKANMIQVAIDSYKKNLSETTYITIPSFQTGLVVRQRVEEAAEYLENVYDYFDNSSNISRDTMLSYLSLANERLYTTKMWAQFFDLQGESYLIDQSTLKESCEVIIDDSLTRIQYSRLYLPNSFIGEEEKLQKLQDSDDYAYCISEASLIKANINSLISTLGIKEEDAAGIVKRKLEKASGILAEEVSNGRFPILGYSYFEYANALLDTQPISALIYAEYALEISNLDIYLNNQPSGNGSIKHNEDYSYLLVILIFLAGIILGMKFTQLHYSKFYGIKRVKTKVKTNKKAKKRKKR